MQLIESKDFASLIQHEFCEGSAISPALFELSVKIIEDLGRWEPNHELNHQVRHQWQIYQPHSFGAIAAMLQEDGSIWQAKPQNPRIDKERDRVIKYEYPLNAPARAFMPQVDETTWKRIANRYSVKFDPNETGFWDWLERHPEIPIAWTEGGKKGLCLLSGGYAGIALVGCSGGYSNQDEEGNLGRHLIADVARFCQPGRVHILTFDQDEKPDTRKKVAKVLSRFGDLIEQSEGIVRVAEWDSKLGKGIDDVISAHGIEVWQRTIDSSIPLVKFAEKIYPAIALKGAVAQLAATADPYQKALLEKDISKRFNLPVGKLDKLTLYADKAGDRAKSADLSDLLVGIYTEIESKFQNPTPTGLMTGFYDLDEMTQGFQRSDLIIVAARPSMGKTAFILNIARSIAAKDHKIAIFSLEMSKEQLGYRMLSMASSIESGRLRSGRIAQNEWEPLGHAIAHSSALPISIYDSGIDTVERMIEIVRRDQPDMVLLDYLQLLEGDGDNRNVELSKITRKLKKLAMELNIPIIALSQLSRAVEARTNKRPIMSDLRESGSIEQDADLIMMLYRDEYYNPDTVDRGIAEVVINKHRNGPTGTIKLLFEPRFTRFKNLANRS